MKKKRGVGLKRAMMLFIIVAIIAVAGVQPAMSQAKFANGKTVWLLMPFTGEYWWNTIVEYVGKAVKLDGWNFNFTTADGSDTKQFDQITTYAQKADILFVFPTSFTGINEAVRIAEEQYHCPVVSFKGYITGKSRFCEMFDDFQSGELMAKEAVAWIQKKYGTTKDKTVIAVNGDLKQSGWKLRQDGFDWIKKNHPEINYIAIEGGLSPEGWADVADSCIAGAGSKVDAIISASDGPYLLGTISALAKYGKLYYQDDPKHIFVASIDGKPSTLQWLRQGYVDAVYSQVPDAISYSAWEVAKKYIVKDASYQSSPYKMPEIPVPLTVKQPEGTYWGGKDKVMIIETVPYSKTPTGTTPAPRVDKNNVNTWALYGNSIIQLLGDDIRPTPTFAAKGKQPAWCAKVLSEYKKWAGGK
jgi:ABC-type sugar transport system substrate-binding protein